MRPACRYTCGYGLLAPSCKLMWGILRLMSRRHSEARVTGPPSGVATGWGRHDGHVSGGPQEGANHDGSSPIKDDLSLLTTSIAGKRRKRRTPTCQPPPARVPRAEGPSTPVGNRFHLSSNAARVDPRSANSKNLRGCGEYAYPPVRSCAAALLLPFEALLSFLCWRAATRPRPGGRAPRWCYTVECWARAGMR